MIQVLVVDDSPTVRCYLSEVIREHPRLELAGIAVDGLDAVARVAELCPDVVLMDIEMPHLNGIEATRRIMAENPVPIVICSAVLDRDLVAKSYHAIAAGALMAVVKPAGIGSPGVRRTVDELLHKLELMAAVKVIRRKPTMVSPKTRGLVTSFSGERLKLLQALWRRPPGLVAIGASAGGPQILQTILARLRQDFPLPILIVQHIAAGFLEGLIDWLQSDCSLDLRIAREGEKPRPASVYFAPDDHHLEITADFTLKILDSAPEYSVRPAVAPLFRSLARLDGNSALVVLLTGMGRDGAREMLDLHRAGFPTLAQDAASCLVDGMPGEAERLGAVDVRLPPEKIAEILNLIVS